MEPTEAELTKYFSSLEDDQLLAASAEREDLTELASNVLSDELKRRRLRSAEAAATVAPVQHLDDASIVTLRRFNSLPEAMAARGALQAANIQCFLRDENAVRTMWHLSTFLGGTRLDVLATEQEAAEAALVRVDAAEAAIPFEEGVEEYVENDYVCTKCGSLDVNRVAPLGGLATIAGWITGRPIQPKDQTWICNECKNTWIDNDHE